MDAYYNSIHMNRIITTFKLILGIGFLVSLTHCTTSNTTAGNMEHDHLPEGKITFMSTRDGNFELYTMDASGNNLSNLTGNSFTDYWASYTPTGSSIFFYSKRDGNDEIYSMDANGNNQRNISRYPANDRLPELSPDGKTIVFLSDRDTEEGEIYTMNVDGSGISRLTTNAVSEDVARWSPDGKKIIYSMEDLHPTDNDVDVETNFELFSLSADGSDEKRLTQFPGFCAAPVFSPDGKHIAFYGRGKEGYLDIYTMKANGSGLKNITSDTLEDYSPAWSPDGRWIAYTSGDISNYDIWIIHLQSGKRSRLTSHIKRDETPVWTK